MRPRRAVVLRYATALLLSALTATTAGSRDAELLLSFKDLWENGQDVLSSWSNATAPCGGSWTGVSCRDGAVTAL